jgi:uncharacterized protein YxjI
VWTYLTLRRSEQHFDRRVACDGAGRRLFVIVGNPASETGRIEVVDADLQPVAVVTERLSRRHTVAIRRPGEPVATVRWSTVSGSERVRVDIDGVAGLRMRGNPDGRGTVVELDANEVARVAPLGDGDYSIAVAPDFDRALAVSLVVAADLLAC